MWNIPRSALIIALALVGWNASPASAIQTAISFSPTTPHAGEAFRIAFGGEWDYTLGTTPPEVEIDGTVIRVVQDVQLSGVPKPPETWAFQVELEPLPVGRYTVQLLLRVTATPSPFSAVLPKADPDLVLEREVDFSVEAPITLRAAMLGPYFPSGLFLSGPRDIRFVVQASAPALSLGAVEVHPEDRRIDVPMARSNLLSPPPFYMEADTVANLDLAPGPWRLRVVEEGQAVTTTTIEVLPFPVRLHDDRFEVRVDWLDQGSVANAFPVSKPSEDSSLFWFFQPTNWEVMVKVLDGCAINGHYWVFGAAQTNLGYRVQIRDTETGEEWEFENLAGTPAPALTDTMAFATCP